MNNNRSKLGLVLFLLGVIGILSMLSMEITIEKMPPEALMQFTPETFRFIMLINPLFLLILSVVAGSMLYERNNLRVPFIESVINRQSNFSILPRQLAWGIPVGLLAGTLMFFYARYFELRYADDFSKLAGNFVPTAAMKILYGGITEEVLLRFGVMNFLVWLVSLVCKKHSSIVYWIAISLAAVLFGVGHLGVLYSALGDPPFALVFYVITGNAFGGIFLGWLYWKKGLEASVFAHMCMHLAMIFFLAVI